jgi:hypothetical protein
MVVASIDLLGAVHVVHSARQCVWRCFLVTWRWGGRDLPGACLHALGWFLSEKKNLYPVDIG